MTETQILTALATDAGKLKDSIDVASAHEYRDRDDLAEIVRCIRSTHESIDELMELEPRIGRER